MFSNLDNFLNAKRSYPEPEIEPVAAATIPDLDDSEDLSFTTSKPSRPKQRDNKPFVPAKGQKGAAKRWNKIKEQAVAELEKLEKSESPADSRTDSKKRKRQSPQSSPAKRKPKPRSTNNSRRAADTNRRAGTSSRRARYVTYEMDTDDSFSSDLGSSDDNGVITLDCDDEDYQGLPSVQINRNLAAPSTVSSEGDAEIRVKVKFRGKFDDYVMPKYQKFSELIKKISTKTSIPLNHIKLTFKEKVIISETDSPNSINLTSGLIIKVHVVDTGGTVGQPSKDANKDKLEIKIRAQNEKEPFIVYTDKDDKLEGLKHDCASKFKCDVKKVRLEFDGDMIDFDKTAADLGLEGGEQMDFFVADK